MNLSKFLTLEESIHSFVARSKGIDNQPDARAKTGLALLSKKVYDPICEKFGKVLVTSGYRCPALNKAVGGSPTSSHLRGEALDLDGKGPSGFARVSNIDLFIYIKDNLVFDQLIAEFEENGEPAWVHVSYSMNFNRGQSIIAIKDKEGNTKYYPYSPELFSKIYRKAPKVEVTDATRNRHLLFKSTPQVEIHEDDREGQFKPLISLERKERKLNTKPVQFYGSGKTVH